MTTVLYRCLDDELKMCESVCTLTRRLTLKIGKTFSTSSADLNILAAVCKFKFGGP